jgi:hypothetical protein
MYIFIPTKKINLPTNELEKNQTKKTMIKKNCR